MHRPDDLIQSIADELAEILQDQPFETLETADKAHMYGAATRVVSYLDAHYQLGRLPGEAS